MKKLTVKEYIFVASMLFGMFFGAGNLIFPVSMGQHAGSNTIWAALGFCITGVGLPLLGIAAMGISESKGLFHMSSKVGRGFAYFFTCALYLTIGPLFAIPRTATVSFQIGAAPLIAEKDHQLALLVFSLLFFLVVLAFSLRPSGILVWIGKVLNPIFLIFLGILIAISLLSPMGQVSSAVPLDAYAQNSFMTGFLDGYNTMDALASLAFGIILIEVIRDLGVKKPGDISLCTIKSGILSVLLMAFIYCALAFIGAQSVAVTGISTDGGTALYEIACYYFGSGGGLFLGGMITFACIKTAIGLVTSCSTTFSELFPNGPPYRVWAIGFSMFSFLISNAGLNTIIEVSEPVLSFLYPITIVLILLCLTGRGFHYKKRVFAGAIGMTMLAALVGVLAALSTEIGGYVPLYPVLVRINELLPLSEYNMGWIIPAAAGGVWGLIC